LKELSNTAAKQGELWGHAARDWADLQEPGYSALWQEALDAAGVRKGTLLLDAGCGAGGACALALDRGAGVFGIDPSVNMITVARERFPKLDLRIAELEDLPFPNGKFDAAVAVNSLQYTANPQIALHELGRVCRQGARVVVAVHGDPDHCDLSAVTEAIFRLFPKRPTGGPFVLSSRETLASLVDAVAGLELETIREWEEDTSYPSLTAAVRAMMAAGGSRRAVEIFGEQRVLDAVVAALERFERKPGGPVILRNQFRMAVAVKRRIA
jgi:ubiquinone/menaquinone biosynthesis C-methylase UbiE